MAYLPTFAIKISQMWVIYLTWVQQTNKFWETLSCSIMARRFCEVLDQALATLPVRWPRVGDMVVIVVFYGPLKSTQKWPLVRNWNHQLTYTPEVSHSPSKILVRRWFSCWEGCFSGAMWNFGRVCKNWIQNHSQLIICWTHMQPQTRPHGSNHIGCCQDDADLLYLGYSQAATVVVFFKRWFLHVKNHHKSTYRHVLSLYISKP